jgi:hypothetical protein
MRLLLAFAALLLTISPATANQKQSQPAEQNAERQNAVPVTVNIIQNAPPSPEQKEPTKNKSHDWYEWFWPPIWSNWAVVVVAAIAAYAGFSNLRELKVQSHAMTKSATATENSVNLQKIALRQWVDTQNFTTSIPYGDSPNLLQVSFRVVNPTPIPIRLWFIQITSSGGQNNAQGFPRNTLLTPSHPYTFSGGIALTDGQLAKIKSIEGLVLPIKVSIIYIDAVRDSWEQVFSLVLHRNVSTMGQVHVSDYSHTIREVKITDDDSPAK